MGMMSPGSIAIVPGAEEKRRNRDVQYLFRQDSDFFYLTGFSEPHALLVLAPGRVQGQEILFCADRDARLELYDGERMGPERACQLLGVDDAFPFADMEDILPGLLEASERIYINLGEHPSFDQSLLAWVASIRQRESGGAQPPGEFIELKHLLHELRLYKSKKEISLMKKAAEITVGGHLRAMRKVAPGLNEGQLEAELTYAFMHEGARSPAYPCIIGGGENACVLHYVANDQPLVDGELVLIDAGCEFQHYAADVTRTLPINGQFSQAQRDIYDVVLAANEAAIASCQVGRRFNEPHQRAVQIMVDGLIKLGLIEGDGESVIAKGNYRHLIPHNTSHWLGIDVHDVGDYRIADAWREFEAGMVLTIEPGIYIPRVADNEHLDSKYLGIGVRIEDDVLITDEGPEVLTAGVPKQATDIEDYISEARINEARINETRTVAT